MNLLDENIPQDQRDILRAWRIRCRVVGQDIDRLSIADDNIIVLLHRLKQPSFIEGNKGNEGMDVRRMEYSPEW